MKRKAGQMGVTSVRKRQKNGNRLELICLILLFVFCIAITSSALGDSKIDLPCKEGQYETVFTVYSGLLRVIGTSLAFIGVGIIFLFVSLKWSSMRKAVGSKAKSNDNPRKPRLRFFCWTPRFMLKPRFLLYFSILWLLLCSAFFVLVAEGIYLCGIYVGGKAEYVEGSVRIIRHQRFGGHTPPDKIDVNGVILEVGYFDITAAYQQTFARGGCYSQEHKCVCGTMKGIY